MDDRPEATEAEEEAGSSPDELEVVVEAGQDAEAAEDVVEDDEVSVEQGSDGEKEDSPESRLAEAINELQQQAKEAKDKWLRAVADADNFRKRARRDKAEAVDRAEDKLVCSFLPVIDNLQRALEHASTGEDQCTKGLVEGVRMVHKQFLQTLERIGIRPFESLGQGFDPEIHEAIQQVHSEYPANAVAVELHQGYRRDDGRLVRPAMVAVSLGPATGEAREPAEGGEGEAIATTDEESVAEDKPTEGEGAS